MDTRPALIGMMLIAALLPGCGGGDGGIDGNNLPLPPPSPAPAAKVALTAANYENAARVAMANASGAFQYANLGVNMANGLLNVPLGAPGIPSFSCPDSGSVSIELTDKNADRSLDPGDTVHYRYDACKIQGTTTSGVIRVELKEATQTAGGGRDYQLTVTLDNFRIERDSAPLISPALTINFIAPVHYVHEANSDFVQVTNGVFNSGPVGGDTGTATVSVDYLQDRATQTYQLSMNGSYTSGNLGGQVDFSTAVPFTGVIGEFPNAGRMNITGAAGSTARLGEEGTAAADNSLVFAGVDANGDGTLDASDTQLSWATVVPVQFFQAFGGVTGVIIATP